MPYCICLCDSQSLGCLWVKNFKICLGLNTNEIQIPYDKHHKVSSLVKSYQNTHNSVKYEVPIKQYLHSILDIVQVFWDKHLEIIY